jgi:squalene-associated FAD-dependent desaturase
MARRSAITLIEAPEVLGRVTARGGRLDGAAVCVVGGGLAGIASALRLADAGAAVTLVEARPNLGGVTRSVRLRGLVADTGQHVFLRCHHEYRDLLARLGGADDIELQDRFAVPVLSAGRPPQTLGRTRLPAPLHLIEALAGYRLLDRGERLAAVRAAAALRRVDPDHPASDDIAFGSWLAGHRQSPRSVRRLWDVYAAGALNLASGQACLGLAARVLGTGLLDRTDGGDVGRARVPLSRLHGGAARTRLDRLGARVLTGTTVRAIEPGPGGFVVASRDHLVPADAVVLAVPHRVAALLAPPGAVADPGRWAGLGVSPVVNVHLRYARAVTDLPFAAAVDCPTQWVFDRTTADVDGQYLVVSLPAADERINRPAGALVREQISSLAGLFPAAARTSVLDAFVTREPYATFRPLPGTRTLRPSAVTGLRGFALAGAWTDTGWPDTMEGAVRSGHRAADLVISQLATARWPKRDRR